MKLIQNKKGKEKEKEKERTNDIISFELVHIVSITKEKEKHQKFRKSVFSNRENALLPEEVIKNYYGLMTMETTGYGNINTWILPLCRIRDPQNSL